MGRAGQRARPHGAKGETRTGAKLNKTPTKFRILKFFPDETRLRSYYPADGPAVGLAVSPACGGIKNGTRSGIQDGTRSAGQAAATDETVSLMPQEIA